MLCGTKLPIYVPLLFSGGMHTIPDATYAPSGGGGHSRLAATYAPSGGGGQFAKFFLPASNYYRYKHMYKRSDVPKLWCVVHT